MENVVLTALAAPNAPVIAAIIPAMGLITARNATTPTTAAVSANDKMKENAEEKM
jgi:hypothetical protein